MSFSRAMLGIPSLKRDSNKIYKQSLEKILFPLQNKIFRIIIVAESYNVQTIQEIISKYQELGGLVHAFVKRNTSIQKSDAYTQGLTNTTGSSTTQSKTEGSSQSKSQSITDKTLLSKFLSPISSKLFSLDSETKTNSTSTTRTNSTTNSKSQTQSTSINIATTQTQSHSESIEEVNKVAESCEKMLDKYIERFLKGLNHGMWNVSLYIQANDEVTLAQLQHTIKSVYSGDKSYFESIRFTQSFTKGLSCFPMFYAKDYHNPIHDSFSGFSTALNTEELSILCALPYNDINGVSVSKSSSFGLTQANINGQYIEIGNVLNKKLPINQRFKLSTQALNAHVFVSGITGSGKTNTIKQILIQLQTELEGKIPFLVIEPAKSEYKHLKSIMKELQIFRPGAKGDIFKLNPFVFEHSRRHSGITLTQHLDMLKVTFSSAFPMYGPMPYILEDALHRIYEDRGWNFDTEDNKFFTDSDYADYNRKSLLFPTMHDLKVKIESVVQEAGYAGELHSNIKAALRTRIANLTLGVKGKIFNTHHAFPSEILFKKPTIIELSHIADDEEKAFLMGLILHKLYSYREKLGDSHGVLKHICVIEEAHRLLPNISLNTSKEEANARGKAVETFINLLAEIRSYGQGIIIADQIASKLHSDVIKNTNIKILQRTMDKQDRDLIGNAINLNTNQILDIAELQTGEAIIHNSDVHQAFMVKIDSLSHESITEEDIKSFHESFLDKNKHYKYNFIFEESFYINNYDNTAIKSLDRDNLQLLLLHFVNATLLDKNIQDIWNSFKALLKVKNEHEYFYLFIEAWKSLNYMSNFQYYKNIDSYLSVYRAFIRLIDVLIQQKDEQSVSRAREQVKESLWHENLKLVFPSMKNYEYNEIDYTLLIVENITIRNLSEDIKSIMHDHSLSIIECLDKALLRIFGTTNENLQHAFFAIRSGKDEINFFNL